jgi:hypothetical protein
METTLATEGLIILTHAEYLRLKRDLKAAGLDLCYKAQISRPVRAPWSNILFQDPIILHHIEQHLPVEHTYRIASVQMTKKAGWFRPDEYTVTFHAVSGIRDADLQQYLGDHNIHTSAETLPAMLGEL